MIYFGIAASLLLFVPNSSFFVIPFFLLVHAYKGIRACVFSVLRKKVEKTLDKKTGGETLKDGKIADPDASDTV